MVFTNCARLLSMWSITVTDEPRSPQYKVSLPVSLSPSFMTHARERAGLAVAGVIGHGESRMVERLIHCRSPAAGKGPIIPTVARDGNGAAGARRGIMRRRARRRMI